jgi:hypothetical protein
MQEAKDLLTKIILAHVPVCLYSLSLSISFISIQKQVVKNVRRFETEYTKTGKTFVSVMKTHSDHRFSSKFFGATKENSYSLAINGEHLISKVKGEEGKPLVSPKITELYWNFLTELGQLQIRRKRNIIKTNDDYDRNLV